MKILMLAPSMLLLFCLGVHSLYAQRDEGNSNDTLATLTIDQNGFRFSNSKKDIKNVIKKSAKDSLAQNEPQVKAVENPKNKLDSVGRLSDRISETDLKPENVYSEKQWKEYKDSLSELSGINLPPVPKQLKNVKGVDEGQLIEILNSKLKTDVSSEADSEKLAKTSNFKPKQEDINGELSKIDTESLPVDDFQKLGDTKLSANDLKDLDLLESNKFKASYLTKIDSIKEERLKSQRLKLKNFEKNKKIKTLKIKDAPTLKDRSYLEGNLTRMNVKDRNIVQFAPTLGYHVTDYVSFGLGPNLLMDINNKELSSAIGMKIFSKVEFLERRTYLQIEDVISPYNWRSSEDFSQQLPNNSIFIGGGYILTLSLPVSINLAVMYQIKTKDISPQTYKPFSFRIGISLIKN